MSRLDRPKNGTTKSHNQISFDMSTQQNTHLIKRTKDHLSNSSWEIFNDRFCAVATIQKQMWFLCSQNRTVSRELLKISFDLVSNRQI